MTWWMVSSRAGTQVKAGFVEADSQLGAIAEGDRSGFILPNSAVMAEAIANEPPAVWRNKPILDEKKPRETLDECWRELSRLNFSGSVSATQLRLYRQLFYMGAASLHNCLDHAMNTGGTAYPLFDELERFSNGQFDVIGDELGMASESGFYGEPT